MKHFQQGVNVSWEMAHELIKVTEVTEIIKIFILCLSRIALHIDKAIILIFRFVCLLFQGSSREEARLHSGPIRGRF